MEMSLRRTQEADGASLVENSSPDLVLAESYERKVSAVMMLIDEPSLRYNDGDRVVSAHCAPESINANGTHCEAAECEYRENFDKKSRKNRENNKEKTTEVESYLVTEASGVASLQSSESVGSESCHIDNKLVKNREPTGLTELKSGPIGAKNLLKRNFRSRIKIFYSR